MFINATAISDHIADTVGAHAASAISATPGALACPTDTTVQDFLDCLDAQLGAITGGTVVTTNTAQTITGLKTFSTTPIFSALSTGLVHSDASGVLTSSLLVDADVDAAAGIGYGKLALTDSIQNSDINSAAAIDYSKLDLADSIQDSDINSAAAIARSKLASGTAHQILVNDGSGVMSGVGPLTNGQLLIGSTGAAAQAATLTGTANQISVTGGAGSITLATPQDIGTSSNVTFNQVTTNTVQATGSGGLAIKANSGTTVATAGAGGGAQLVVEGALETNTSLIIQDPGAGTNAITVTAPSGLSGSYSMILPDNDGNANQVLGTNGSGTLSWVDATSGYSQNSDTTLTASDTIAIGTGNADRLQHWRVQSNGGAVTLSTTPFGSSDPQDRTIICLVGLSDSDTVTIPVNDAANGVVGQGDVTLNQYSTACFRYLSTEDRYVIESRSN